MQRYQSVIFKWNVFSAIVRKRIEVCRTIMVLLNLFLTTLYSGCENRIGLAHLQLILGIPVCSTNVIKSLEQIETGRSRA